MYESESGNYTEYSLKIVILSLILTIIYYFCFKKTLAANIIYIILVLITVQANNFIAAYRGDAYIKKNYKNLYDIYHKDYVITPDNITLQIILKINFKLPSMHKESVQEEKDFLKDKNYNNIKSETLIALAHALFSILYSFIFLALSFIVF